MNNELYVWVVERDDAETVELSSLVDSKETAKALVEKAAHLYGGTRTEITVDKEGLLIMEVVNRRGYSFVTYIATQTRVSTISEWE